MADLTRKEQIFRQVSAGLILAAIGGVFALWHKDILAGIGASWNWLFASVETTRVWYWFLIIWLLFTLYTIAHLGWTARRRRPEYYDYREDSFFGVTWRWGWGSEGMKNLAPFCPECDRLMCFDQKDVRYGTPAECVLFCKPCNCQVFREGELAFITKDVAREIELKTRKGTWKVVRPKA